MFPPAKQAEQRSCCFGLTPIKTCRSTLLFCFVSPMSGSCLSAASTAPVRVYEYSVYVPLLVLLSSPIYCSGLKVPFWGGPLPKWVGFFPHNPKNPQFLSCFAPFAPESAQNALLALFALDRRKKSPQSFPRHFQAALEHSLDIPSTFQRLPRHSLDIPSTFQRFPRHSLDIPSTFPSAFLTPKIHVFAKGIFGELGGRTLRTIGG